MTLPRSADVVVIGGGVVGCSLAYHLAVRGLSDVLVLEREAVGSGTTSKAAGGIQARGPRLPGPEGVTLHAASILREPPETHN